MADLSELILGLKANVDNFNAGMASAAATAEAKMAEIAATVSKNMDIATTTMESFAKSAGIAGKQAGNEFEKGLTDGMNKANAAAKEGAVSVGRSGEAAGISWGKGFRELAGAAALAFLLTFEETVHKAMELASQLNVLHIETGESTANLQRLQYAFATVGVESGRSQMLFAQFQRQLASAAEANNGRSMFERMGLDPKQMMTSTLTQNFDAVADKIKNLGSAAQKTEAVTRLFGRTGAELLPVFNAGGAGLDAMRMAADKAGAVIETGTLKKLEDLHRGLSMLGQTTVATFAKLAEPILTPLLALVQRLQEVMAWFQHLDENVRKNVLFGAFAASIVGAENALKGVSSLLANMEMRELAAGLAQFIPVIDIVVNVLTVLWLLWTTNFANARDVIRIFVQTCVMVFQELIGAVTSAWRAVMTTLGPALALLSKNAGSLFIQIASLIQAIITWRGWFLVLETAIKIVGAILTVLITIIAEVIGAIANWNHEIAAIINAIAGLVDKLADADTAMANFASKIPGGATMAKNFLDSAKHTRDMANGMHNAATALDHLQSTAKKFDTSKIGNIFKPKPSIVPEGEGTGTGTIGSVPKKPKKGPDEARSFIDDINADLQPFKDKMRMVEDQVKMLGQEFAELGKQADTQSRLNAQMSVLHEEAAKAVVEYRTQIDLVGELQTQEDKLAAKMRATSGNSAEGKKQLKEYATEMKTLQAESATGIVKMNELQYKHNDLVRESIKLQGDYNTRLANAYAASGNAANAGTIADLENEKAVRNAADLKGTPSQRAIETQARVLADAFTNTQINVIKVQNATNEYNKALVAYKAALDNAKGDTKDIAVIAAQTQLIIATNSQTLAVRANDDAQATYKQTLLKTTADMEAMRKTFGDVATRAVGPFGAALQAFLTAGPLAGLATLFTSLFEKTKAFHDITVIMTRIFDALAQVLSALRPVIDVLLGVLVGIVNVFLMLGNVLITVLNLFGAHIEKLRLVNTSLNDLGNASGNAQHNLIQIAHDLPTMNEFNSGKMADLVSNQTAQAQNANNLSQAGNDLLDKGFSQSLTKFGEMVGWLIAIHTVLGLLAAAQTLFGGGGATGGGGLAGFIGKIGSLFTTHAAATTTPLTADAITSPLTTGISKLDQSIQDGVQATKDGTAATGQALTTSSKASSMAAMAAKGAAVAGGAFGIYDGYRKGGVSGALEAGAGSLSITSALLTGGAAAGPAGLIIAGAIAAGALLMHHDDPNKMPDKYNTQEYGSGVANLMGFAGANGQNFTEDAQTKKQLGGKDELDYINAHIEELMKINPALAAEFKGASSVTSLHDGTLGLNNGTQKRWNDLLNDANTAVTDLFQQISTQAQAVANDLTAILSGATDTNLSSVFGNGSVVTSGGGYSVTPGGSLGGGTTGTTRSGDVTVNVNVGTVNGGDPALISAALAPMMRQAAEEHARIQQRVIANERFLSRQENV